MSIVLYKPLASIRCFISILRHHDKEVHVQAGSAQTLGAYIAPRVAGFPETPLQAKLPLGARHREDKRAPPDADRTHIWEELLLPSPAPPPGLCDFLDVVLLRTKHSLDSVWTWQDIQEVQIFQEPRKFCDCHGAWLPGGSSSQCSSPGDLDGWMQNVL